MRERFRQFILLATCISRLISVWLLRRTLISSRNSLLSIASPRMTGFVISTEMTIFSEKVEQGADKAAQDFVI